MHRIAAAIEGTVSAVDPDEDVPVGRMERNRAHVARVAAGRTRDVAAPIGEETRNVDARPGDRDRPAAAGNGADGRRVGPARDDAGDEVRIAVEGTDRDCAGG